MDKRRWYDAQEASSGITRRIVAGATSGAQNEARELSQSQPDLPYLVTAATITFDGARLVVDIQVHDMPDEECPLIEVTIVELEDVDLRLINNCLTDAGLPRLEPHHILYLLSGIWTPDEPIWGEDDE